MSTFEERRNARVDRLLAAAHKREKEADALRGQAHTMSDAIPFGQPILVGHHSERRDRNYRARIENKYRKAGTLADEAKDLQRRAEAAQNNNAIFSDDPDAPVKLQSKIAELQDLQAKMVAANKLIRKNDRAGLAALGFSETQIAKLFVPDFLGRVGFPDYALQNNNANIRRLKERLQTIERKRSNESTTNHLRGVRVHDNVEDNRLQLFFPDKPADAVRAELKAHGFRWSKYNGCWQAYRGNNANYYAKFIIEKYYPEQA